MRVRLKNGFAASLRSRNTRCLPTRILEKQNRLQMVFRFGASTINRALLFKDSMSGTEERVKLLDSRTNVKCTHRSKSQALPASLEELPGLLPLTNFGPA